MKHAIALAAALFLATVTSAQEPEEFARTPPSPSAWVDADYLAWKVTKGPNPNPLVTTGPPTGFSGALGQPGTQILYGQNAIDFGTFNGLRMSLGVWLDETQDWGLEGGGFFLSPRNPRFVVTSDATGRPVFAQPVNIPTIGESSFAASFPDQFVGQIQVDPWLRLYSWEINGVARIYRGDFVEWDLLVGFRNLRLSEQLSISSNIIPLVPGALTFEGFPVPANSKVFTLDSFGTSNDLFMSQLATRVRLTYGQFSIDVTGKLGLGGSSQMVNIQGGTFFFPTTTATVPTRTAVGGILALVTNQAPKNDYARFVVVPEVGAKLNWDVLDVLRITVGYCFLYVSDVVRPGNQIDRTVNPNFVPTDPAFGFFDGPNRPTLEVTRSTFWAHGISAGLEFRF